MNKCFHWAPVALHQPVVDRFHSDKKKMACSSDKTNTRSWPELTPLIRHVYLTSAHNVRLGRQQVDDLPFALVSPLRAEHHRHLVARIVTRSLLQPGGGGLAGVLVVFRRPGVRHDGAGCGLSARKRTNASPRGGFAISVTSEPMMSEPDAQISGQIVSKAAESPGKTDLTGFKVEKFHRLMFVSLAEQQKLQCSSFFLIKNYWSHLFDTKRSTCKWSQLYIPHIMYKDINNL